MNRTYQRCTRCVMDTTDPDITFNENGVCNHCLRYEELYESRVFNGEEGEYLMNKLAEKIKNAAKGREYDCIIGVSGGVDSTYVAYLVKNLGLRPLAVHLDNGWNSELAVHNIREVLDRLDIDLYTHVIDWEEFRDLQLAFLKSSTSDSEIPTDHAIFALLWKEAAKRNIKYIISGMNFKTESISLPGWHYGHSDWTYVKDVHKKHGTVKLTSYPHFSLFDLFYINIIKGVRTVSILNYVEYNKEKALDILCNELGYRRYEGKHHESIYTRFFQTYILPQKFKIDKRITHLSDLINSSQLTREEALKELEKEMRSPELLEEDKIYVAKKFGISVEEFDRIMALPRRTFREYKNNYEFIARLKMFVNKLRLKGLYPK